MLLHAKTYEDTQRRKYNVPIEDSFWCSDNSAIVADGVTRDSVEDMSKVSLEDIMKLYPKPSLASMAAIAAVDCFAKLVSEKLPLKQILEAINDTVREMNSKQITNCDYLMNDYSGVVAAGIRINNSILEYSYIGDCGIIVYDKNGRKKFQTSEMVLDNKYVDLKGIPWEKPEARIIIRKNYRNKPSNKTSLGVLTGEDEATFFINFGSIGLKKGDFIIIYSDGLVNYLKREDFFSHIGSYDLNTFDNYIEDIAMSDYLKYGKEKTLVILKY